MHYYFGIYHWRRRLRAVAASLAALVVAALGWRTARSRRVRAASALLGSVGVTAAVDIGRDLLTPAPWAVDRRKYDALAAALPLADAATVLDVGCGTGRSVVGLSAHVPPSCSVTGVDLFTDDIILGNAPRTARRNAANAGLDATVAVGDATALPFADDSQDVVTVGRMFHDLSPRDADRAIAEARRVCAPDGRFGMIELPFPPGDGPPLDDPVAFWRAFVADAGFTVERVERLPWTDGREYVLVTAIP